MNENEEKPPGLKLTLFLNELVAIRHKYHIAVTEKITPEIEARRIAILVANWYLTHGGNVHQAGFLERDIYEAVKMLDLTCDPIPDETRIAEAAGKKSSKGAYGNFNPLKLSIEGKEQYLTNYTSLIYLIIRKLNTFEVKEDERIPKLKSRRLNQRRATHGIIRRRKINYKKMESGKKSALREVGQKAFCLGAGLHGLGHETEGS